MSLRVRARGPDHRDSTPDMYAAGQEKRFPHTRHNSQCLSNIDEKDEKYKADERQDQQLE